MRLRWSRFRRPALVGAVVVAIAAGPAVGSAQAAAPAAPAAAVAAAAGRWVQVAQRVVWGGSAGSSLTAGAAQDARLETGVTVPRGTRSFVVQVRVGATAPGTLSLWSRGAHQP